MVHLYKDPKRESIFKKSSSNKMSPTLGLTSNTSSHAEMDTLRKRIVELESKFRDKVLFPLDRFQCKCA